MSIAFFFGLITYIEPVQPTLVTLQDAAVFQGNTCVLTDLNFTIDEGEFVYLIGRTGSGKSTLLKTLYAALPLTKGKGEVVGKSLRRLNRKTIPAFRRKLGIVFQDFNLLFDRDVTANLEFVLNATGWKEASNKVKRIGEVLTQVGLQEKSAEMPFRLSGGEQQRLVLARALLNKPKLLIADEPTGNLDPETSDDVMLLIRRLATEYNMAVLFATHDYRIIEQFPARILRCQNGRVLGSADMEIL
jgi:cell division transport system ATP-binding protein